MFTMDFKSEGITWVGNIYDKFEAMCHEVEDVLSVEETAKYVENQVQDVGGNIKKICAEVMKDLLPPSLKDHVKGEMIENSITKNAELETCKKSKDNTRQEIVPRKIMDVIAPPIKDLSLVSFLGGVPMIIHLLPPDSVGSDFSPEQNDTDMHKKSKVDIEDDPLEKKLPSPDVSEFTDSVMGDSTQPLVLVGDEKEDHLPLPLASSHDDVRKLKKSIFDVEGEPIKDNALASGASTLIDSAGASSRESTSDIPCSLDLSSHLDSSVVLFEKEDMEYGQMSPSGSILLVHSNDSLATYKAFHLKKSLTDEYEQCDAEVEEFATGVSDDDDLLEFEDSTGSMQNVEQFDNVKLEGSCVVVQPFTVSSREYRHRSYKKKLRDALAWRMRSSKKKEFETGDESNQHRSESSSPSTRIKSSGSKNLPTDNICEWEML